MKYFLALMLMLVPVVAAADRFEATGPVLEMLTLENADNQASDALSLFYVEGFQNAGGCYVSGSTGHVALRIRNNDQGKIQSSMVLTAFMSGKRLFVRVDDSHRDGNQYCFVQQVKLNKNF